MQTITIVVIAAGVEVVQSRVKSARLKFYAPGLEVYVFGTCPRHMKDAVVYHALEQCRIRHIPTISLVALGEF